MGLSTTELTAMRAAISELLPDTCYILTVTNTSDGEGGVTSSWGTTGTSLCRLDVKQGKEQISGGAIQAFITTMLSLPYDTTVTEANRVVHGGVTYAVTAPPNSDTSWIAVKRVMLERI